MAAMTASQQPIPPSSTAAYMPGLKASSVTSSSSATLDGCTPSSPRPLHISRPASPTRSPRDGFLCTFEGCGKEFKAKAKLEAHLTSHSDIRPFSCLHSSCGAAFKRKEHLQTHELRVHSAASSAKIQGTALSNQRKFICTHHISLGSDDVQCGKSFWTNSHLQRHIAQIHEDADTLETASKGASQGAMPTNEGRWAPDILHTLGTDANKAYKCVERGCDASFFKRKRLREHVWAKHSLVPDRYSHPPVGASDDSPLAGDSAGPAVAKPFVCSFPGCAKAFPTMVKRRQHTRIHEEGRYTCSLPHPQPDSSGSGGSNVILSFSTWSALQKHIKEAHPPVCPYPECASKTFKTKENLNAHVRRHREREVAAASKVIGGRDAANASMEASDSAPVSNGCAHWNLGEVTGVDAELQLALEGRIFPCTILGCNKTFKSKYALTTHFSVNHLGIKRFICGETDVGGKNRLGEGCGWKFGHKHELVRHLRICKSKGKCKQREASREDDAPDCNGDEGSCSSPIIERDDEYFRQEGGAVPQRDAQRPPAPVRAHGRGPSNNRGAATASVLQGLLAAARQEGDGRGKGKGMRKRRRRDSNSENGRRDADYQYSSDGDHENANDDEDNIPASLDKATHPPRKVRKMRGAVLGCPWDKIVELRDTADAVAETAEQSTSSSSTTTTPMLNCTARFSRLYDLARHVQAVHSLRLTNAELLAVVSQEEARRLPKPRGSPSSTAIVSR
ncbi:hypothetical protein K437DRAFT_239758 [Tilletiaria anomala UBC 951]|uniref:C2H2-type domain-containing protein n=1 Tax=Tilletiaria anomala (strain ATCC 24038 / CBS 436.72 / UBC 951) TaxID=1037660 RepID=A0A066VFD3_TILAU|nr:uncharacterized protein K437DRAFT_239758 [Tilletiaria anomala UBC 951]KDN39013.1 hypothetical protein K437DRAFT_239758 [Tilletiaria anomala UBC 951]